MDPRDVTTEPIVMIQDVCLTQPGWNPTRDHNDDSIDEALLRFLCHKPHTEVLG